MSLANDNRREDVLTRLMAEYDDALAAKAPTKVVDESVVDIDAQLALEWCEVKECINLLDRARRRSADRSSVEFDPSRVIGIVAERSQDIQSTRRLGRFQIKRELGRGGLGIVYLAHDPQLRRDVALKIPRLEALVDDAMSRRFVREAEAAARLSHPHLVTLLEVGQDGPICYLTSEYCPGPTLTEWLRERRQPVPVRQAAQLVLDLAGAVEHAHSRGVLHRDIKPSNVLLEPSASSRTDLASTQLSELSPKLTDFGMAKLLEQSEGDTRSGAIVGTVAYMSPEQAEGRVSDLDARTDVYMLGAVLYELLTGAAPFAGKSEIETLRQLIANEPAVPRRLRPDVPRDLESIALKCLAKQPSNRYATAHELATDLQRFLTGQPTVARPVGMWERSWKWARRRPAVATAVVITSIAVSGLLGVSAFYSARLATSLDETRQLLYATDMQAGFEAWHHGGSFTARERLDRHIPADNQQDLRTFPWRLLWQLCEANQHELYRHDTKVTAVDYSPDGKWIASAEINGAIRLWDVAASRLSADLTGHIEDVNDLAFSPDSRFLASACDDHTVRVWEVGRSAPPKILSGFSDLAAYGVAFAPDGTLLAVACEDERIRVWDTRSWTLANTFSGHAGPVMKLTFSPDGVRLASCSSDGTVRLISASSGELLASWDARKLDTDIVSYLAISHDGAMLATGGRSGERINFWSAESGALIYSLRPIGGALRCLAFSPDDRFLVAGLQDGAACAVDVATFETAHRLLGHNADVRDLAFSPDGSRLITAGADGAVKNWDILTIARRDARARTAHSVSALAFQPNGPLFAFADDADSVTLVDTRSGDPQLRILNSDDPGSVVETFPARGMSFSGDGKLLAYSARNRSEIQILDVDRRMIATKIRLTDARVMAITFSSGDLELFAVDDKSRLTRWDLRTAAPLASCSLNQPSAFAVEVLKRDNVVVTVAKDSIRFRDPRTLVELGGLPSNPQPLLAIALSPDESLLAAGTTAGDVLVWDLVTRVFKTTLVGHTAEVRSVDFSHDGTTIVSCGLDGRVRLWDVSSAQEAGSIVARDRMTSVRFSPDGNTLAAGGDRTGGGAVQFWSAPLVPNDYARALVNLWAGELVEYACLHNGRSVRQTNITRDSTLDSGTPHGASMTIDGGRHAHFQGTVVIGDTKEGNLTISGHSTAQMSKEIAIGRCQESRGKLELVDHSINDSPGNILVGKEGTGELHIDGGSIARYADGLIGSHRGGEGSVLVQGHDSKWILSDALWVGDQGHGRLRVADGARAIADGILCIGTGKNATGSLVATGEGTVLTTLSLIAGDYGEGMFELENGAVATAQVVEISQRRGSKGQISVAGAGATLACNGACFVGGNVRAAGGEGALRIDRGGLINIAGSLKVYDQAIVSVDGGTLRAASVDIAPTSVIHYRSGTIEVQSAKLNGTLRADGPQFEEAINGARIKVMSFDSLSGHFAHVEGPPGIRLEPVYSRDELSLIVNRVD